MDTLVVSLLPSINSESMIINPGIDKMARDIYNSLTSSAFLPDPVLSKPINTFSNKNI